jgi:molybdenum cofactor cytidylyltransferase
MKPQSQTAGIILAAGESVRFGRSKQLLKLKDKYLIEWVLDAALGSCLKTVVLVLGYEHQAILQALGTKTEHPSLRIIINPDYRCGQSTSLKAGLLSVRHSFGAVMYLLGDQPLVSAEIIDRMLDQFEQSEKEICVPVYKGQRGNPVIFRRSFFDDLMQVSGDIGARNIISDNSERTHYLKIDNPMWFFDIDTGEDLDYLLARLA